MRVERGPGWVRLIGGPVPPGMSAITLGRLVIVRSGAATNDRLLRHELVHVGQWRRHGVVGFLVRYLGGYVRGRIAGWPHIGAYRRIGLEAEAEWVARGGDRPASRA